MAFGMSGVQGENTMVGGDVALVWMDEFLGHVDDYNLTDRCALDIWIASHI